MVYKYIFPVHRLSCYRYAMPGNYSSGLFPMISNFILLFYFFLIWFLYTCSPLEYHRKTGNFFVIISEVVNGVYGDAQLKKKKNW